MIFSYLAATRFYSCSLANAVPLMFGFVFHVSAYKWAKTYVTVGWLNVWLTGGGEAVYKLNEASICRFYAELLLRTANKVTSISTALALKSLAYVAQNINFVSFWFSLFRYC